jgi:hypothetical protein
MIKRFRTPLLVAGIALAATACSPREIAQWEAWHAKDPAAATAYANKPSVQAQLRAHAKPHHEATARAASGHSGVNWDAVARCESGGQWNHGQVTNRYGTFSGGLMIMNSVWRQFGGTQFAPYAGAASKAQQIIVAERIAARVGAARAWQCPTPHV